MNIFLTILFSIGQICAISIHNPPDLTKKYVNYDLGGIPPKQKDMKRIIIIGDSVTVGMGRKSPEWETTWPGQMFKMMPDRAHAEIVQCAMSVRTMSRKSGTSFLDQPRYQDILKSDPDIIVIQLGTGDSKEGNWDEKQFKSDYNEMLGAFKQLKSRPHIFPVIPTPLY